MFQKSKVFLAAIVFVLALIVACSDDDSSGGYALSFTVNGKAVSLSAGYLEYGNHAFAVYEVAANATVPSYVALYGLGTGISTNADNGPTEYAGMGGNVTSFTFPATRLQFSYYYISGTNAIKYTSTNALAIISAAGDVGSTITGTFTATQVKYQIKSNTNSGSWVTLGQDLTINNGSLRLYRIPNNIMN